MFSAFQAGAFQIPGFQISQVNVTGKPQAAYTYVHPFQLHRIEEEKRAKLRKEKSDLDKLESVVAENRRRAELIEQSRLLAIRNRSKARAIELAQMEQDYLLEITRLLMVKAELMRRIQQTEQVIIAVVVMKKRRLRIAA